MTSLKLLSFVKGIAKEKGFTLDSAQVEALSHLALRANYLVKFKKRTWFGNILDKRKKRNSLYIWGGVGRGKTFIVDCFYKAVPLVEKKRIHFHQFMEDVHRRLKTLQGRRDPLSSIGKQIGESTQLLCLDEFQITDIGDAMIMHKLLESLFSSPIILITTSNTLPNELYKDGLQRQRFLPAIDLILSNMTVHNLDKGIDYRLTALSYAGRYHLSSEKSHSVMRKSFSRLSGASDDGAGSLKIQGRYLEALRIGGNAVWFEFEEICGGPRGQSDYIEITKMFHTVFISNIPKFDFENLDKKRRLTWLVDEFYDQSVNLVVSAEGTIQELFSNTKRDSETLRTESRLIEMQSDKYIRRKPVFQYPHSHKMVEI